MAKREKLKKRSLGTITTVFIIGLLSVSVQSQAATVAFDLNFEFSGATAPEGTAPWLTATIDDGGTAGSATLTMDATGLTGTENVDSWYFNVTPESLLPLNITYQSGVTAAVSQGANAFKADGDGLYDILFDFPTGSPNDRFGPAGAGTLSVYTLDDNGAGVLTANSFDTLSMPAGGHGPFTTAAHIMSIGPSGNDSGWIAPNPVPVPSAVWLFGTGLIGLIGISRRKGLFTNK